MEKLLKIKLRWTFTFIMMFILLLMMFTQAHEAAHAEVCTKFGGRVVSSGFNMNLMTFTTVCEAPQNDMHNLAQANIEAFGYQSEFQVLAILMIVFVTGWLAIWLADARRNEQAVIQGKRLRSDD